MDLYLIHLKTGHHMTMLGQRENAENWLLFSHEFIGQSELPLSHLQSGMNAICPGLLEEKITFLRPESFNNYTGPEEAAFSSCTGREEPIGW